MKIPNYLVFLILVASTIQAKPLELKISGVKNPLVQKNIEAHVKALRESSENWQPDSINGAIQMGEENIRAALKPYGYYTPVINIHVKETPKNFRLSYEVLPGIPVRVAKLELMVIGEGKDKVSSVFDTFPLKVGYRLQDSAYEQAKSWALASVMNQGYLKAQYVVHRISVDTKTHQASIQLILDTGPLYYFGEVHFSETPFNARFLERYLTFKSGDPFKGERLTVFQSALNSGQYFKSVQVTPLFPSNDEKRVPIEAQVRMKPTNQYQIGMGYGTDTNVRGVLNYKRRYLNQWGHQVGGSMAYSGLRDRVEVFYTIPGHHPERDNYQLRVSNTDERFDDKSSLYRVYDVIENRGIGDWTRTLQLQYYQERFKEYLGEQTEENRFLLPTMTWTKTIADHILTPTHGYKMMFSVKGALNTLLSDQGFVQGSTQLKSIYTLPSYQKILTRLELGASYPGHTDDLPIGLRYFAGGDFSLRGYGYKQLGPTKYTPSGEKTVIGGRYLGVASLEVQQPLWGKMALAGFIDAGNAMNRLKDGIYTGVGVGFRYQSPIGSLRFDIAKPLREEGNAWRIHMNIGADL